MPAPRFVHLRLHSEYSIVDSTLRIDQAIALASADEQGALAITDLGNLFGFVKFYKAARAAGIKPICGVDLPVEPEHVDERALPWPPRVLLLAMSTNGYLNLCRLITRAWCDNQKRGVARLDPRWLDEQGASAGLFCLSGGWFGEIGHLLRGGQRSAAKACCERWAARFDGRFALEIHRAGFENEHLLNEQTVALATATGRPVVATHPIQFARSEDWYAHEARVCVAEGYTLADPRRPRRFTEQQRFATQADMESAFPAWPQALENSVRIAQLCNLELTLGASHLPEFPLPPGVTIEAHLANEVARGLGSRLAQLYPDPAARDSARPHYEERAAHEIATIVKMGFPGYFLIVADFIGWAKRNGIPVGPGRGSGAGSLVAYALGITDLDPLRYNLLFERFLNPERVSMPDFDIDFCQDGRDRVIDYVRQKYGVESVGQIATFGTMAAKAAVRDCGRVLDLPYGFVDGVAKLIPFKPGQWTTLAPAPGDPKAREANTIYAFEAEPALAERRDKEEDVAALLDLAAQVEGLPRNVGMHAGGVLIAPGKLTDFCPLYRQDGESSVVSQYDKDDIEAIGLVKFDFLGLTTLTIIDWTLRYCKRLDSGFDLRLADIPLDDPGVFRMIREKPPIGIFQFESSGMQNAIQLVRPDRLEDLTALNALFRPGPMDLIPDFASRKDGKVPVDYYDPRLRPILEETYGIMIYQEQVMQVAQIIGGYSLGGADLLRRAMGKKKPEEMAKHRGIFVEGAVANGVSKELAGRLFDDMEKFAGYGFNKSHAAAYALLAYQTAWLKRHHTAAFFAANMSALMSDTDKLRVLLDDARTYGIRFEPPDINTGEYRFVPTDRETIRYGLGAVKGTGEAAINDILRARRDGPFASLFDFCGRVNPHTVNRRSIEALIRAGAFDGLHAERASLLASLAAAMSAAVQAAARAGQDSLFGDDEAPTPPLIQARPWSLLDRLANEKAALGLYLSGHPYDAWRQHLAPMATVPLARLAESDSVQRIAGVVHAVRVINGRHGRICFLALDDRSEVREIRLPEKVFEAHRLWLKEDVPLVAEVKVRWVSDDLRIEVGALYDLASARARFARRLIIHLNGASDERAVADTLAQLAAFSHGAPDQRLPVKVRLERRLGTGPSASRYVGDVMLGDALRIRPQNEVFEQFDASLEF